MHDPPQHPRRRQPVSWYDLPADVLPLIFEKLTGEFEAMLSCARVCFSWRSVIGSLNTRHKANKPLLILADKPPFFYFYQEPPIRRHLYLFDTRNSKSHVIPLPMSSNQFHCCSYGWLFIVGSYIHDICFLNPLSGFKIMLPSLLARQFAKSFRVVTSSNPLDPTCVVLGAPLDPHNGYKDPDVNFCPSDPYCNEEPKNWHYHDLVFCRPHVDQTWKKVILDRDGALLWFDIILFKNQFYGMSSEYLYRISFDGHAEKLIESPFGSTPWCFLREFHVTCYLVDLNGYLVVVVVTKLRERSASMYGYTKFKLYKLDTDCGEKVWIEITNLGGNAIYLGSASSVAVTVSAEEGDANSLFFLGHETTHQLRLENQNPTQGVCSMPHSTRPMQWFHSM